MKQLSMLVLVLLTAMASLAALPRNLVVVEVATGTWCTYCPGAAMACHDLLQNGDPVAIVKNHGSDSFANVYSNARNSLYGVTGYPTGYFDGVLSHSGGSSSSSIYSSYLPYVQSRMAVESHYTIAAAGSSSRTEYSVQVLVTKPETDDNTNVRLHAVLTESSIPFAWFNQTTVENVNRLMIPDQNGTPISLATGGQVEVSFNFELQPTWVANNCELVLFLQNMTSKEILQARKYTLNQLTGGYPLSLFEHDFSLLPVGTTQTIPVTIANYAPYPVAGTVAFDNPDFTATIDNFNILPYNELTYNVTFAPTQPMNYSANMTLASNLWNYPLLTIPLTGVGYQLCSDYGFQVGLEPYSTITGGTVLGNATTRNMYFVDPAVPLGGTATTGPGFPIGFNFNYLGMDFDRLAIHSNAWISLGQSDLTPSVNLSTSNHGTPMSSVVAIDPPRLVSRISALARYLQAQAGAELRIDTIGEAPNRECVIQWTNYRRVNITGDSFNFQIRLLENGNRIQMSYGNFSFGNTSTITVEVGMRGMPDNPATNWQVLTSTSNWAAPEQGTTNTSRMTLSSLVYPASGTTYTFFPGGLVPEAPILAYPADGTADLPLSGFDLGWTPAPSGGPVDYYAVYLSDTDDALFDQYYWETTEPTFDPVAQGGIAFNYGERWFWTVEAHNEFGSAVAMPAFRFDLQTLGGIDAPIVAIAADGTLSWQEVANAGSYNVFKAEYPDGQFILVGSTAGLSWLDPNYPESKAFYRVTAVTGD